jgi:hypothetical protein
VAAEADKPKRTTARRKVAVFGVGTVCAVGLLWFCLTAHLDFSPWGASNLWTCTRIEIEYQPSALEYFEILAANPPLLSPEEREHLQSLKTSTVSDTIAIKLIAHALSRASYSVVAEPKADKRAYIEVRGYRGDECMASFGMYDHRFLVTDDGRTFDLQPGLDIVSSILELNSFCKRSDCAERLLSFAYVLSCGPGGAQRRVVASEWCETIWLTMTTVPRMRNPPSPERRRRREVRERERDGQYRCPGGGEGRCHYAMNPDCGPNSAPDTVLIFEAGAGWNQHGGPELFTFDHHCDPRGGCVLLNDGTVKFIRTEEELKQLRWK